MKLTLKHGLFFGFLIGVISALLYAPKAGKELRAELKDKASTVPEHFFSFMESLVDLIVSIMDFTLKAVEEQKDKLSKAVETGLHVAKDKSNELKKMASNIASR